MRVRTLKPICVGIFAKAPVAGLAKTRLIPRLGAAGASELQLHLIERTVGVANQAGIGPVSLWCTPDQSDGSFQRMRSQFGVTLFDQAGDDLGARMSQAFSILCTHGPALLVGCDCVVMTPSVLVACARYLNGDIDAVFVPVEDGGYIAVGLRLPEPTLFQGISWGTPNVMRETRERVHSLSLKATELRMLWDIDEPEDYDRAVRCNAL